MLVIVQVHLVLRDPPLQRKLRAAIAGLDVVVTADDGAGSPADVVREATADLIVVREALLEDGLAATLAGRPAAVLPPAIAVVTTSTDPEHRSRLLADGATVVFGHADRATNVRDVLATAVATRSADLVRAHRAEQTRRHGSLDDFASDAPSMQPLLTLCHRLLRSDASVLIQGETGVGKERLARAIHTEGTRTHGPFVAINCAAIPESLMESELFGHERGAFTGADRARRGRFETAHGGTILLDEIGEMPLGLQTKLLRVLQERTVERVGGEAPVEVDVRVIAATNRDLKSQVTRGAFRADLYYRLAVFTLVIPPLRERPADIDRLADRFLAETAGERATRLAIDDDARAALTAYAWPGNVRELINVLERAALLTDGDRIGLGDLPDELALPRLAATGGDTNATGPFAIDETTVVGLRWRDARAHVLTRFEGWYLSRALAAADGDVSRAAAAVGMPTDQFAARLDDHGLA